MEISGLKNCYISVHVCMTLMMNSRLWEMEAIYNRISPVLVCQTVHVREKIYLKTIQKCTITLSVVSSVRVGFTEHHIYLSIIGLYYNCFQLVVGSDTPTKKNRSSRSDPGFWIDRLTSVIRYGIPKARANGHHPCFQVISDLWSTFNDVCMKYQSDAKIIEKCCR